MTQVPDSVATGARERIRQAEGERKRVLEAIWAGRPMEAEPDAARKVSRIQAVTGVDRGAAEALARYEDPAALGLAGPALSRAERIQGKTVDFLGVAFLETARAAAASVGRVAFRDLRPQGSGLMVSDRLFLTNNHVIASPAQARQFVVQFNYELDPDGKARAVTQFEFAPDLFFFTSPEDVLDFTLVAVGGRIDGESELGQFGYCPLLTSEDKHMLGDFVNVIQHPEGNYKQVVIRENRLVTRLDTVLHYVSDTLPGSSGSPVFNDEWEVIALHHWGEPYTMTTRPDGRPVRRDVNEGVRISAIARALQAGKGDLSGPAVALLDAVLNPPSRRPSALFAGALGERAPAPSSVVAAREPPIGTPSMGDDGTISWTIPLTVSLRLGAAVASSGGQTAQPVVVGSATEIERPSEAAKIDRRYDNRGGYDPDFLPGHHLDLPRLSETQRAVAARKLQVAEGEDPYELTYEHFSIVMNAERRLAFFTAVNIDGPSWVAIKRAADTSGPAAPQEAQAAESAEAAEKWFDDPRISREAQTDQSLYDKQLPKRVFDRGHLVRRQDPAWGTKSAANRANNDTFHFCNCAPQEARFNQDARLWQGIENYVLDNAKADDIRVTVFTGPVFADDDPDYRYVNVPLRFWKIVVRVERGELLATALLADQSDRLTRLPERMSEGFDDVSKVKSFQTSVAEIEQLTGLDFALRDHDTFQPGAAEALGKRRLLSSFRDISLSAPRRRAAATKGSKRKTAP